VPSQNAEFWENWKKTKLASLRRLSRKQIHHYYDYFSRAHYAISPDSIARDINIAAEDRMVALQSELEFRRTREIQIFVATIGAAVLIGVALFQQPCNENANTEHSKTQIAPAQPVSSSQPSP
jgi:hypothetical protein